MGICLSVKASPVYRLPPELRCIFDKEENVCILYDANGNKKWCIVFREGSFNLQKYLRGKPASSVKSCCMSYDEQGDETIIAFSGNIYYKHLNTTKEFVLTGNFEEEKITFTLALHEGVFDRSEINTTTYFSKITSHDKEKEENEKSPMLLNNL